MKNTRASLLLASLALSACGDDNNPSDVDASTDVVDTDTAADAGGDATVDAAEDTDATPDVVADAGDTSDAVEDSADTVVQPPEFLTLDEAVERVNPFIGSGGVGFGYASLTPAAQLPVGFVKVGPDTTIAGSHAPQNHFSGYYYTDPHARGFSHVRLVGTGATDLGNLRFLPFSDPGDIDPWRRWTPMDKDSETASPGYYAVTLPDAGVRAEMAAADFGAIHRYTYDGAAMFQIDPASSITDSGTQEASITVDGTRVTGWVTHQGGFAGRSAPFTLYYDVELDTAPTAVTVWDDDGEREGTTATGTRAGAVMTFDDEATVVARLGVSLIDADAAEANRLSAIGDASLEDVAEAAEAAWRDVLDNVAIAGGTEREQTMFYSALYNAYRMPSRLSEPDGRYVGFDVDAQVRTAEGHAFYSDLSMWDTFRTLHPWYSLTDHTLQRDCLQSLLRMNEQGSRGMPRWPAMLSYSGSMIGSSADIVFGDAASKGVEGVDWEEAYNALYNSAYGRTFDPPLTTGRDGIESYVEYGYLPADLHDESVSKTLEYAWDDFGLANVARAAGLDDEAAELDAHAQSYLNLFRDDEGFLWPRNADGSWVEDVDDDQIYMRSGPFTEGSAWHWRFYGWHDAEGYAAAYDDAGLDLADTLETFFTSSSLGQPGRPSNVLPGSYYWHGNEPAIHVASIFHIAGEHDRASHWTREIQERLYNDTPDGIPGNDDGGTMSTWYLFTTLGLYPVAGSDLYYLNAPLFERAVIQLGGGGTLTIEAPGASFERRVVTGITLNGEPLDRHHVQHAELIDATLEFTLEDMPADE